MASNPLSVPITGGAPAPYTAGVGVQAPRIQGAPIAAPSNISEILNLLNGTAETVTHTNELRLQSQRRNKQEVEESDHADLLVLQKEADLWKTLGTENPIVYHSEAYKKFETTLRTKADAEGRTPYYQAGVAGLLENSTSHRVSVLYTTAERAKAQMEHDGRQIAQTMEPYLKVTAAESEGAGLSIEDTQKAILATAKAHGADTVPEAAHAAEIYSQEYKAHATHELNIKVQQASDSRFTTGASDLKGLSLILQDKRIEDEKLGNQALSNANASVASKFSDVGDDYSAKRLSVLQTTLDETSQQLSMIKNPTPAQDSFIMGVRREIQMQQEHLETKMAAKVAADTVTAVNTRRRFEDVAEEDVPKYVTNVVNEMLGEDAIHYTPTEGFMATDPAYKGIINHLDKIQEHVHDELKSSQKKIKAMQQLFGGKPVASSDFSTGLQVNADQGQSDVNFSLVPPKTTAAILPQVTPQMIKDSEINVHELTPKMLESLLSRYPKGTDLGPFKTIVTDAIQNPRGPDGQPDIPRIEQMMTVLKGTDYARSGILQNYTGMDDQESMQLVKASVWGELHKVQQAGGLADTETRKMLEPIIGSSQNPNDLNSFMNFVFSPMNPAGSEKTNQVERPFDKTAHDYGDRLVAGSPLKSIFSAVDMAMAKNNPDYWASGSKELRLATRKVVLHSLGVSLVDDGTTITPVRDTYGHVPDAPKDTMEAAVNFVPDAGSYLHRSTLYNVLGREPTADEVRKTNGMSIGKLFTVGAHPQATDPGRWSAAIDPSQMTKVNPKNFSVIPSGIIPNRDMMGEDGKGETFARSPLSYVRQGDKIYIKGLSDQSFSEVFGWGLGVKGTNGEINGFYVNSTFESIYKNAIENNRASAPAPTATTPTVTPDHSVLRDANRGAFMMAR